MEHVDCHLAVRFLLVKQATDFQPRQLIEPLQVPPQGLFRRRRCQLALQQLALQIPEECRLVLTQVWFDPVFKIELETFGSDRSVIEKEVWIVMTLLIREGEVETP